MRLNGSDREKDFQYITSKCRSVSVVQTMVFIWCLLGSFVMHFQWVEKSSVNILLNICEAEKKVMWVWSDLRVCKW